VIQASILAPVSLLGDLLRKDRWPIKIAAIVQDGAHPQDKDMLKSNMYLQNVSEACFNYL